MTLLVMEDVNLLVEMSKFLAVWCDSLHIPSVHGKTLVNIAKFLRTVFFIEHLRWLPSVYFT